MIPRRAYAHRVFTALQRAPIVALLGARQCGKTTLAILISADAHFWATYQGAELDLLFTHSGRSYGIEVKYSEAPTVTKSMRVAMEDLGLEHLWVIHPGAKRFPADERITLWPAAALQERRSELP